MAFELHFHGCMNRTPSNKLKKSCRALVPVLFILMSFGCGRSAGVVAQNSMPSTATLVDRKISSKYPVAEYTQEELLDLMESASDTSSDNNQSDDKELKTSGNSSAIADQYKKIKFNGTKSVTKTIVITQSGTYDFKNVLYIWKGSDWPCGNDLENGPQILRIEANNVTVKNFAYIGDGKNYGSKGLGDPIHITTCGTRMGNECPVQGPKNVTLDKIFGHACEDMITIGTPGAENITIKNSTLIAAPNSKNWDKTIQTDFGRDLVFKNNHFVGGSRCLRLASNTKSLVTQNHFENCKTPIYVTSKSSGITNMQDGESTLELKDNDYDDPWYSSFGHKEHAKCNDHSLTKNGTYVCK